MIKFLRRHWDWASPWIAVGLFIAYLAFFGAILAP